MLSRKAKSWRGLFRGIGLHLPGVSWVKVHELSRLGVRKGAR